MRRTLFLTTLLLSASAFAQTTIDITSQSPATTVCSYPTDRVATGSTPGHLTARLTGSPSGAGCTVGGSSILPVSFGPASPLAPNGAQLAGGTAPQTFTIQPLNAASCTASIATAAGLGVGTLTSGSSVCTSQATCAAGALNIPASFTNTSQSATSQYTVTVTCNAAAGAIPQSAASSVTVNQAVAGGGGGGSCSTVIPSTTSGIPSFTHQGGNQSVFYFSVGAQTVDVSNFDSLFLAPWPGNPQVTAVVTLPTSKYISAKFHVPTGYLAGYTGTGVDAIYGNYSVNNSQFSATVSMSISTTCGDFAYPPTNPTSTVLPGCWKNKGAGNAFVQWRKESAGAGCVLRDNTDYYFNFINADVSGIGALNGNTATGTASSTKNANCGTSCTDPIANNPEHWSQYVFP